MVSITPQKTALLIRLDRIGDLVLTLPADEQPALKDYRRVWFISKGLGFVPEHAVPAREFQEWKKEFSWRQFLDFIKAIRALKPDVSISFQSPAWVMLALFIAGVPLRIGVLSRWPSFLFLNRGIRQKRSQCLHHEMEYNHLLVHDGLGDTTPPRYTSLKLQAQEKNPLSPGYVIIHPGMAGSALNWPRSHYKTLIEKISHHYPVVITGTATDKNILEPLKKDLTDIPNIIWQDNQLNAKQLLAVISGAKALFAPSTGVIHLAASLGIPTFGIYSPIRVESVKRWGPKGPQVYTMTPAVAGPDCMALVTPSEIYNNMMEKLNSPKGSL